MKYLSCVVLLVLVACKQSGPGSTAGTYSTDGLVGAPSYQVPNLPSTYTLKEVSVRFNGPGNWHPIAPCSQDPNVPCFEQTPDALFINNSDDASGRYRIVYTQ